MWTPHAFQKHPRLFAFVTFLLVFLPSYIDALWSLYERIEDRIPEISLEGLSINHLYWITVPIGLYFLIAIWVQTREPPNLTDIAPKGISDLGKALLKMLVVTVTDKVQLPNEDQLINVTKLDRLTLRVELRNLEREGFLYQDGRGLIHLSDEGEDYIQNELSRFSDKDMVRTIRRFHKKEGHEVSSCEG
ncbi:hypothetical protein MYX75_04735 [Acidobacteria bacterium AH-259-A15]|nr:hypothetical protein [Acidobacteria bacterium AH-259-A15]